MKKLWPDMTKCPFCTIGTLRDVTPRLAEALRVKAVQCDVCGQRVGHKVGGKDEALQHAVV